MEQAQLFAPLGARVTMLVRSRLARREEPEVAAAIRDAFSADGITVIEGSEPSQVEREGKTSSWRATDVSFAPSNCSSRPAAARAPTASSSTQSA